MPGNNQGLLTLGIALLDESATSADGDHQALIAQDAYRHAYRTARHPVFLLQIAFARHEGTRLQLA